jgi:hypothetical protein
VNLFKEGLEMSKRKKLRLISLVMLVIAVIFVFCALSNPGLGRTLYIGNWRFGAEQWRFCYKMYAFVMIGLFGGSFFAKE